MGVTSSEVLSQDYEGGVVQNTRHFSYEKLGPNPPNRENPYGSDFNPQRCPGYPTAIPEHASGLPASNSPQVAGDGPTNTQGYPLDNPELLG